MFAHTYEQQTMEERREIAVRRINTIIEKEFVTLADVSLTKNLFCLYNATIVNSFNIPV